MGSRYQQNRHNAGYLILDHFANDLSIKFKAAKGDYYISKGVLNKTPFFLIKPVNYVNNSGIAASQFLKQNKIDLAEFLVVCDDINIETGKIRVRRSGGDGGHNGIGSIIYHLNSDRFPRLRVGIGSKFSEGQLTSYVLDDFSEEEENLLLPVLKNSSILIKEFIKGGIDAMLNANSKLYDDDSSTNCF
jgi:PTH1 family peptidyl-tRNA hydrolase